MVFGMFERVKKFAQDDPRRVLHALKVGLAVLLVSLLYYYKPLYNGFGSSALDAMMTVIVVFEFSVGATLGKGLNKGVGTLLGAAFAVGIHFLTNVSEYIGQRVFVFFLLFHAVLVTFVRFNSKIQARYDFGFSTFILTFCFISLSSYRDDQVLRLACKNLSSMFVGSAICVIICIMVFPVWAGEDLHNLIASNIEELATFLEGFGDEYFKKSEDGEFKDDKSFLQRYKSCSSDHEEETLANLARWEPGHDRFRFRHPWKQYLKIGALTRQCANRIESLSGHLNAHIQAKQEIQSKIQETYTKMSLESGKALKELAVSIETMAKPDADIHIEKSKSAAKNLMEVLPELPEQTVTDVLTCVEEIAEAVLQLAFMAKFETDTRQPETIVTSITEANCLSVAITIDE